jgi:hypothetical protein
MTTEEKLKSIEVVTVTLVNGIPTHYKKQVELNTMAHSLLISKGEKGKIQIFKRDLKYAKNS